MNQNGVGSSPEDPIVTVMAQAPRHYEVAALLTRQFGQSVGSGLDEPAGTIMPSGAGKTQLVGAAIDKYYGSGVPSDVTDPLDTATAKARFGLNAAYMEQANTDMVGHSAEAPVSTIVGKGCTQRLIDIRLEEVEATAGPRRRKVLEFLWKHFGEPTDAEWSAPCSTMMGRLRFGLVILAETVWQIGDIGMRMLVPRELFSAQGFPADYTIDRAADGRPITKTAQTSMAGNSVSPPPAEATLRANLTWMDLPERAAA
jgi:DNA (cytosine-5)-methyltransferase 1